MEATTIEREYLTYAQREQYTGLHRVTLWRAVRDGRLKASGYGRAIRFRVRDLDELMAGSDGGPDNK